MNPLSLERARYDLIMEYSKLAYPHFQKIFNTDNKMCNVIAAYVFLDCAVRALGVPTVQATLDACPEIKALVAATQLDFPVRLKQLSEEAKDNSPTTEPGSNIIHVDFKAKQTK